MSTEVYYDVVGSPDIGPYTVGGAIGRDCSNCGAPAGIKCILDTSSREVRWFVVYEYVSQLVATTAAGWPTAGTSEWLALADDDPAKLAAVLEAGVHWSLRIDTEQEQRSLTSKVIAAEIDPAAIAQRMLQGRGAAYIERRKAS